MATTQDWMIPVDRATLEMRSCLQELRKLLICELCSNVFTNPHSLACGHCFCKECIDNYDGDNWECPAQGCRMPLTASNGSYRKIHPTLQTALNSYSEICETLRQAKPQWWIGAEQGDKEEEVIDLMAIKDSQRHEFSDDENDFTTAREDFSSQTNG